VVVTSRREGQGTYKAIGPVDDLEMLEARRRRVQREPVRRRTILGAAGPHVAHDERVDARDGDLSDEALGVAARHRKVGQAELAERVGGEVLEELDGARRLLEAVVGRGGGAEAREVARRKSIDGEALNEERGVLVDLLELLEVALERVAARRNEVRGLVDDRRPDERARLGVRKAAGFREGEESGRGRGEEERPLVDKAVDECAHPLRQGEVLERHRVLLLRLDDVLGGGRGRRRVLGRRLVVLRGGLGGERSACAAARHRPRRAGSAAGHAAGRASCGVGARAAARSADEGTRCALPLGLARMDEELRPTHSQDHACESRSLCRPARREASEASGAGLIPYSACIEKLIDLSNAHFSQMVNLLT